MAVITGILLGLSTLAFIGPVLFYLLKSALESGFKAGVAVASGIIIGDIICVFLAFYGAEKFFNDSSNLKWISLGGAIILLTIGLKYFLKPTLTTEVNGKFKQKNIGIYFINGFLINFVNPFVFAVWFGFVSYNQTKFNTSETITSLITTLIVIFATDLLKAYFSNRLITLIKPKKLRFIFKVFGVIMIVFSIRLLAMFLRA
jgi:threonine/homoserine/homoserine lactone efflux protein